MTPGQTRVLVLLGILLMLEMVLQPNIKAWLQSISNGISGNLGSAVAPATQPQSIAQQVTATKPTNGKCPAGSILFNGSCIDTRGI